MFTPLPQGAREGHPMGNPKSTFAVDRQRLWNKLNANYVLPKTEYLFMYEMRELEAQRRWAPPQDMDIWNKALAMCCPRGINKTARRQALKSSRILDAREQALKMAYLLHACQRPPLIKVRRGKYHTLVYITYCCMMLDDMNLTMWKIAPVSLPANVIQATMAERLNQPYIIQMMLAKRDANRELQALGMDTTTDTNYNLLFSTMQMALTVNKMKILQERYPDSHRQHTDYINIDNANVEYKIGKIREQTWLGTRTGEYADLTQATFNTRFNNMCWLAICFDPLFSHYNPAIFAATDRPAFYREQYDGYKQILETVDAQHQIQLNRAWDESHERQPRRIRRRLAAAGVGQDNRNNNNNNRGGTYFCL